MIINKKYLIHLLAITVNLLSKGQTASIKISESDLNKFKYGAEEFTMTIHGDTGVTKEAQKVMELAGFDAFLHLGDYDYACDPNSYFNKFLSSRSFKFFGILGNHESANQCGEQKYNQYITNLYNQMKSSKNSGTSCVFSPKKTMWSCVYKNMRIIGLSPSISKDEKRYEQLDFLKKYLSQSKEDWKICAWHYYDDYYHTGKYQYNKNYISDTGESFYDYCRSYGAIIFSAHDHVYARTHVMSKFSTPKIDSYDYDSPSNIVQIREGATLDFLSAVGGYEIYIERDKYKNYSHWQKKFAKGDHSENEKKFGTLNCKFNVGGNNKKAFCQFLRINSSPTVFDSFTIYRNDDPKHTTYDDIDSKFLKEKVTAYEEKYYGGSTSSSSSVKYSTNGRCGSSDGRCPNDQCCSKYGWCSTSRDHCDIDLGCQTKYGVCKRYSSSSTKKTTTTTTKKSTTSIRYSTSNQCGKNYGKCRNNECCSKYNWCGTSSKYCDAGCQSLYGKCW